MSKWPWRCARYSTELRRFRVWYIIARIESAQPSSAAIWIGVM